MATLESKTSTEQLPPEKKELKMVGRYSTNGEYRKIKTYRRPVEIKQPMYGGLIENKEEVFSNDVDLDS